MQHRESVAYSSCVTSYAQGGAKGHSRSIHGLLAAVCVDLSRVKSTTPGTSLDYIVWMTIAPQALRLDVCPCVPSESLYIKCSGRFTRKQY